jgi:hypothetical protein
MDLVIRILLALIGLINFLPSLALFSKSKLENAYGIKIENKTIELLLTHRAFLFGILGGFTLYSSMLGIYYSLSLTLCMLSMCSFLLFAKLNPESNNPQIKKIMILDWVGIFLGIILIIYFLIQ